MITLESKLTKVKNMLEDKNVIVNIMPAYMDLREFNSISDLQTALQNSDVEMNMFYKFATATVVSLVCDKADEFETGYANGWSN